jgi:hypothetical protein
VMQKYNTHKIKIRKTSIFKQILSHIVINPLFNINININNKE